MVHVAWIYTPDVYEGVSNPNYHVINFAKNHVITTLNPKIMFEETQMTCSLIMKFGVFMSYFIYIL